MLLGSRWFPERADPFNAHAGLPVPAASSVTQSARGARLHIAPPSQWCGSASARRGHRRRRLACSAAMKLLARALLALPLVACGGSSKPVAKPEVAPVVAAP